MFQEVGPRVSFLDDALCLMEVTWYTSSACQVSAVQSSGCKLRLSTGFSFDLTGLGSSVRHVTDGPYTYQLHICGETSEINTACARPPSPPLHVAQLKGTVCTSLGVGSGSLRYVDGSLSLSYSMGDACHSNFARTSVINFVCPEEVGEGEESAKESVKFISEDNCFYEFEWATELACGAKEKEAQCQFDLAGSSYNFGSLVSGGEENWVAVDDSKETACFLLNPCGVVVVTEDSYKPEEFCEHKVAPAECSDSSVCQVLSDGTVRGLGSFQLQNSGSTLSISKDVLSVSTGVVSKRHAVVRYVCKPGDFASPPVFTGQLTGEDSEVVYEFQWSTFAACPQGSQIGRDCSVAQESTGFLFNLSSLSPLQHSHTTNGGYEYSIAICNSLNQTGCSEKGTAVCQSKDGHHKSAGVTSSSLLYADGTLKLHYYNGTACSRDKVPRNSTLIFECDSTAHTPVVEDVTEVNYCQYVVEVRTKLACPPAYRATECVYVSADGTVYDLSPLSKATGNWQASGPDGSLYYLNLCQSLNRVAGCSPLSAACRVHSKTNSITDLGLTSSANFSTISGHLVLRYNWSSPGAAGGQGGGQGACQVVETLVQFSCSGNASAEVSAQNHPLSG